MKLRHPFRPGTLFLAILMIVTPATPATQQDSSTTLPITSWLSSGPAEIALPAFQEASAALKEWLHFDAVNIGEWRPAVSAAEAKGNGTNWQILQADSGAVILNPLTGSRFPQVAYLTTYVEARRWTTAQLQIKARQPFVVYLNGEEVLSRDSADSLGTLRRQPLKLERGKHLLVIKTAREAADKAAWKIRASLSVDPHFGAAPLSLSLEPRHHMDLTTLLDGPQVTSVSISWDGQIVAVALSEVRNQNGDKDSWVELRRAPDGRLQQSFRGLSNLGGLKWVPRSQRFSFTTSEDQKTALWVVDLSSGETRALLRDTEHFGDYDWSPDGRYLIYSIDEEAKPDERGVKRWQGLRDRWPWFRTRSSLYQLTFPEGVKKRLTAGKLSSSLNSISPDGKKILFSRTVDDPAQRPYTRTVVAALDLQTLAVDTLFSGGWINQATWSPDGGRILVTGSASLFNNLGSTVPEGMIANEYDTQAYLFDPATRQAQPLTRGFDPAISEARWGPRGESIYFLATDGEYVRLFRCSAARREFQLIRTEPEVINGIDIAGGAERAVFYGSSVSTPTAVYHLDLSSGRARKTLQPGEADFHPVIFGKVEAWSFQNQRGRKIEGRIYYPPDFDPQKIYPAIVYYYGGTTPTSRDFGGRYPKNLFAAQGYVVYVLQPSGAIGYGQEFSALHVNDWGKIVADEIIDGTRRFLEAHPFVDPQRVGCIGASYGGFMTMLLLTRTDLFATGVAHAGISDIASYWGEGYWGFLYSAAATANSFPWNRRDIYVEQSPLFHADQVKSPLLLLHGDADTNVPRGESDQFYTALKLLGKEVEYVQVAGQDHHILDYKKRIIWEKTILAWFDRWLQSQPQWWNELYPAE